jgi:hypothetical protein
MAGFSNKAKAFLTTPYKMIKYNRNLDKASSFDEFCIIGSFKR